MKNAKSHYRLLSNLGVTLISFEGTIDCHFSVLEKWLENCFYLSAPSNGHKSNHSFAYWTLFIRIGQVKSLAKISLKRAFISSHSSSLLVLMTGLFRIIDLKNSIYKTFRIDLEQWCDYVSSTEDILILQSISLFYQGFLSLQDVVYVFFY